MNSYLLAHGKESSACKEMYRYPSAHTFRQPENAQCASKQNIGTPYLALNNFPEQIQ